MWHGGVAAVGNPEALSPLRLYVDDQDGETTKLAARVLARAGGQGDPPALRRPAVLLRARMLRGLVTLVPVVNEFALLQGAADGPRRPRPGLHLPGQAPQFNTPSRSRSPSPP